MNHCLGWYVAGENGDGVGYAWMRGPFKSRAAADVVADDLRNRFPADRYWVVRGQL